MLTYCSKLDSTIVNIDMQQYTYLSIYVFFFFFFQKIVTNKFITKIILKLSEHPFIIIITNKQYMDAHQIFKNRNLLLRNCSTNILQHNVDKLSLTYEITVMNAPLLQLGIVPPVEFGGDGGRLNPVRWIHNGRLGIGWRRCPPRWRPYRRAGVGNRRRQRGNVH